MDELNFTSANFATKKGKEAKKSILLHNSTHLIAHLKNQLDMQKKDAI